MDIDLVRRAQQGDRDAFGVLASLIGERMRRVAFGILRDVHLAEDATQQAALDMWRDLPQLRDPARFEAWSYRILVRACQAEGRKARRWLPNTLSREPRETLVTDDTTAILDRDQLDRAFRHLSVEQRTVVVLRYYLDLPLETIAEALDIPVGTVNSRLYRAMQSMRASIEADARAPDERVTTAQEATR